VNGVAFEYDLGYAGCEGCFTGGVVGVVDCECVGGHGWIIGVGVGL